MVDIHRAQVTFDHFKVGLCHRQVSNIVHNCTQQQLGTQNTQTCGVFKQPNFQHKISKDYTTDAS